MGISDELIALEEEERQDTRLSFANEHKQEPERAARVVEMQMQTGLPVDLIERNLEHVEEQTREKFDPEKFRKESPVFAKWAAENPHHPSLIDGDYEALSGLEWVTKAAKDAHKAGWATVEQGKIGRRMMAAPGGKSTPEDETRLADLRKQFPAGQTFGANEWYEKLVTEGAHLAPTMEHALIEGSQKGLLTAVGVGSMAVLAGSAGPQAFIPEEVVTVPAAAGIGYAVGTAVGAGQAVGDLEAGLAYLEFRETLDENGEPIPHDVAYAAASMVGVINAGLETLGLGKIAKHLGGERLVKSFGKDAAKEALKHATFRQAVTRYATRYAESVGTEVTTEVLQEATNILAGEIAKSMSPGEFDKMTAEQTGARLSEIAVKTLQGTAIIGAVGPTSRFVGDTRAARNASNNRLLFEALGDNAKASKLRERSPAKFREYIDRLREDGGIDKIRIPVDRFDEYFQSRELNPAEMAREITGSDTAYSEAQAGGSDIEIALSDYATKVAPSEHHAGLIDDLRLRPDDMTAREAKSWNENSDKILTDLEDSLDSDVAKTAGYDAVFNDVLGQLVPTMERETAERNATLMASVFNTLGERTGQDPKALYDRYGLRIIREVPEVLRQIGNVDTQIDPLIDRLRAGDVPTSSQVYGPSMLDFVKAQGGLQDQGGELSARDVRTQVRGLVKPDGLTLDEAAEQAFDAGYIQSHDLNEFMEALDSELQGSPVFTGRSTDETLENLKGALDELDKFLGQSQIDLTAATNDEVRALLFPQVGGFEQSGIAQTASIEAALKRRGLKGDDLLNVLDLANDLQANGGRISADGMVTLFHRTTPENAEAIIKSQTMSGKEDRLFFGTSPTGQIDGYGDGVVQVEIPLERLELNDVFTNEAHVTMKSGRPGTVVRVAAKAVPRQPESIEAFRARMREAYQDLEELDISENKRGSVTLDLIQVGRDKRSQGIGTAVMNELIAWADASGKMIELSLADRDSRTGTTSRKRLEKFYRRFGFVPNRGRNKRFELSLYTNMYRAPSSGTLYQQSRASITIDAATRQVAINLSKASDLSSFLHESAHFYLEVLGDLAESADAPPQIVQDYAAILNWIGVENRQGIKRDQHEQFARGFEAYLYEGHAPSVELQHAFARFRAWLVAIYRRLSALNVELSDDIRGVFDRLVATDDAIQGAEESQNYVALFTDPEVANMTPEQYGVYQRRVQEARIEAEESLTQKLLSIKNREQKAWWKEEREKIRELVETEIHKMKVYRALSFLQKGTAPDGLELDLKHVKLSRTELTARYGKDFLKRLPRPYVYQAEGGISSDEVALMFGYRSGDQLVQDLVNARPMKALIEGETDARMREKYPDPAMDGSLVEEAITAVHNEKRAELLAAELRTLRKLARQDRPVVRAVMTAEQRQRRQAREANRGMLPDIDELRLIKRAAQNMIGQKIVRDVNPAAFRTAEAKAARKAFEAAGKGDYQTAYTAKRQQILNHELYRAATKAKEQSEKIRDYFRKFDRKVVQQRLGKAQDGILEKILTILSELDLKKISGREIDRAEAKRQMLAQIESGVIIAFPGIVAQLQAAKIKNWREMTVDDLAGMRDVVKQLESQARAQAEAIINGEKLRIESVAGEMADSVLANGKRVKVGLGEETRGDRGKHAARQVLTAWLGPGSIARLLDGGKDFGPVTRYVVSLMRQAYAEKLIPMQQRATEDVAAIYEKHYSNKEMARFHVKRFFGILAEDLSKSDVLSLALNWGNDSNRKAVLAGIKAGGVPAYTEAGVGEALATLDSRDWQFVQDVWDYIDTYWGRIAETEKRRRGIAPKKIQATPFTVTTADGKAVNVRGGYYPLDYNPMHSDRTKEMQVQDYFDKIGNGVYVSASTRAGATHERVGSGGQVVRLGLNKIDRHLREITRDLALGDEVNFIKRLLSNKTFKNAMKETGNREALQVLNLWLEDAAVGEMPSEEVIEKGLGYIRTGFVKAKLGWNLMTTALQFTGFAQTWAVVGSQAMGHGTAKFASAPVVMHKHIMESSAFMRARYQTNSWNKDVADTQAHLMAGMGRLPPGVKTKWRALSATFFLPIARAQMVVDEITWLSGYWHGAQTGLEGQDAIHYADTIVEKAQTSGFFTDRSGLERGTLGARKSRQAQWVRIWTTLISYMLRKANLAYEKGHAFKQKPSFKGAVFLASDIVALFVVEAALSAAIYGRWPDDDDDEQSFAWWLAKETAGSAVSGIPFVREIPAARFGSGNTAVGGITTDLWDVGVQIGQWEVDDTLIKELNNVGGTLFHYPSSQTNRLVDALWREHVEGEDVPPYEYLTGERNK